LISGIFVLVPLAITVLVVRLFITATASVLQPFVRLAIGSGHPALEMVVSVTAFLLLVYLLGLITTHIIGRRLVAMGEALILRIPIVKSVYSATKQVIQTLSPSGRAGFKSVVLVNFAGPAVKTLGFVTGSERKADGSLRYRIFLPTAPNPTTGFLFFVEEREVETTEISIEDALKLIVSGGALPPARPADGWGPVPEPGAGGSGGAAAAGRP
jgi:uncharacterized membrane protein